MGGNWGKISMSAGKYHGVLVTGEVEGLGSDKEILVVVRNELPRDKS